MGLELSAEPGMRYCSEVRFTLWWRQGDGKEMSPSEETGWPHGVMRARGTQTMRHGDWEGLGLRPLQIGRLSEEGNPV